jgi:hypothetical protein
MGKYQQNQQQRTGGKAANSNWSRLILGAALFSQLDCPGGLWLRFFNDHFHFFTAVRAFKTAHLPAQSHQQSFPSLGIMAPRKKTLESSKRRRLPNSSGVVTTFAAGHRTNQTNA